MLNLYLIVIIVIICIILASIYTFESKISAFQAVGLNELTVNKNKNNIVSIMNLMNKQYPDIANDITKYGLTDPNIDVNSPLNLNLNNLNTEFRVKFIQEQQNKEIAELENELKHMPKLNTVIGEINSIKHQYGGLFGLLSSPNQIGEHYSIVVKPEQGLCIQHINTPDTQNNINLTACDYNPVALNQKFILEPVNNNTEFNAMLEPDMIDGYGVTQLDAFNPYPFTVIRTATKNPASPNTDFHIPGTNCVTIDNNNELSLEPCVGKESQRFYPNKKKINMVTA